MVVSVNHLVGLGQAGVQSFGVMVGERCLEGGISIGGKGILWSRDYSMIFFIIISLFLTILFIGIVNLFIYG